MRGVEKHIHRMRRTYAKKRNCLKQAIIDYNFPGELTGIESGLNGLIELNPDVSAEELTKKALEHGIFVTPLSRYTQSNEHNSNALVLGYSALSLEDIKSGIEILSSIAC